MSQRQIHLSARTIKLLKGTTGINLDVLGLGNSFLDITTKAYTTKGKKQINQTTKITNIYASNDTMKKVKTNCRFKNIFANYISGKGIVFRIIQETLKTQQPKKIKIKI